MIALAAATASGAAEAGLADARAALAKWVEARQLTGKHRADWLAEKETLQQMESLYAKELENLQGQLHSVGTNTSRVENELAEATKENEALKAAAERIKGWLAELEKDVLRLAKRWPEPLLEKVKPLLRRVPEDPATTKAGLAERMQNVVGLLSEADKFNGSLSLATELRKNAAGSEVQVRTLYVGLAAAYFTDKTGEFAGLGMPGENGWTWQVRPELAARIMRAIAIHENLQPAAFLPFPITIK